jgi:hypothetical protein
MPTKPNSPSINNFLLASNRSSGPNLCTTSFSPSTYSRLLFTKPESLSDLISGTRFTMHRISYSPFVSYFYTFLCNYSLYLNPTDALAPSATSVAMQVRSNFTSRTDTQFLTRTTHITLLYNYNSRASSKFVSRSRHQRNENFRLHIVKLTSTDIQ